MSNFSKGLRLLEESDEKHVMQVMTPKDGDYRVTWDTDNDDETSEAKSTFERLQAKGMTAFEVGRKGEKTTIMKTFDPDAEAIIFAPPIVGG